MVTRDLSQNPGGALQWRSELVSSHSSLPGVVEGVNCMSAAEWVHSMPSRMAPEILVVALLAIVNATIACSYGVFLVTISATVQAAAAWMLLLDTEHIPILQIGSMVDTLSKGGLVLLVVECSACQLPKMFWEKLIWPAIKFWAYVLALVIPPALLSRHHTYQGLNMGPYNRGGEWEASRIAGQGAAVATMASAAAAVAAQAVGPAAAQAVGPAAAQAVGPAAAQAVGPTAAQAVLPAAANALNIDFEKAETVLQDAASKHRITLAECMEPLHRPFYNRRIRKEDICMHLSLAMAFLGFLICVGLAIGFEQYYTGIGMCLGRCHNKEDCWANISLRMDNFDQFPKCPEVGHVVRPAATNQCPVVEWMVKLGANVDGVMATQTAGQHRQCTAVVRVSKPGDGDVTKQQPVGSGVKVRGSWTPLVNNSLDGASNPLSNKVVEQQTDHYGIAHFLSEDIGESYEPGMSGCRFTVLDMPGHRLDRNFQLSGNHSWHNPSKVHPSPHPSPQPRFTAQLWPVSIAQSGVHPNIPPSTQGVVHANTQSNARASAQASTQPTAKATSDVSFQPSVQASAQVTYQPSAQAITQVSIQRSAQPSPQPNAQSSVPSGAQPSAQGVAEVSHQASTQPSAEASGQVTLQPSALVSRQVSIQPVAQADARITFQPSTQANAPTTTLVGISASVEPSAQACSEVSHQPNTNAQVVARAPNNLSRRHGPSSPC